jgi:F0F1-type ATP synthase assembly protein I
MGAQLALAVLLCGFLGRWLDGELGTAPWLMIVGLAVGVLGGFVKFIRTAMALGRKADDEAEHHRSTAHED